VRITLQDADAARLDVDLSDDGVVRFVSLTGLREVVGQLDRGVGAARLRPLRARSLCLAALDWPLPGGRLSVTSPALLGELSIELDAADEPDATPLSGRVLAGRVEADAVAVELPSVARLVFDADLRGAEFVHSPERIGHAAGDRVELANVQAVLGGVLCRLSGALLERARVDWRARELLIGAAVAGASGISLALPGSGLTVDIDRAELPGGLRTSAGAIVIPELVVPEIRVVVDDLLALFAPSPKPGEKAAEKPAEKPAPFDLGFLDRVTGRLGVDMTLDMTIPVIGRREGTHRFRVPISGGLINYRELERDLSNFEDAFIDVEVRGQTLVIERAIPLIPGLEKPLVVWDLDAEELELARRRLVRLRTIPRLRLASRGGGGNDKSSLAMRSLRFDDIDIEIALDPAQGRTDSIGRATAEKLHVVGRLVYEPQRTAESREATEARFSATRLAAGPLELGRAGGRARVEVDSIELGAIEDGVASFVGLRPRGASFTGRDLRVRNLRILFG
jgi:hypothetical protein